MMQSRGLIRRTIEKEDRLLVSFPNHHDGYFYVIAPDLRAAIRAAEQERKEISFTYDETLCIHSVAD